MIKANELKNAEVYECSEGRAGRFIEHLTKDEECHKYAEFLNSRDFELTPFEYIDFRNNPYWDLRARSKIHKTGTKIIATR